jgi:putative ABC transport system permease protein
MSIWRLVLREIRYRKFNFALGLLAVVVAVGALTAVMTLLHFHDQQTESLVSARERQTIDEMRLLEDKYRKITVGLGFNLRIFHKDQDAAEFHRNHFASHYLPDDYAGRLARARVITVNHLLPILHEYVTWPELNQKVHIVGTPGEIPIAGSDEKKPIVEAIPRSGIVLGWDLGQQLHVKQGDSIQLLGRSFTVRRVHLPRGSDEDITAWVALADAQQLLHQEGKINVILALECNCEASNRLEQVRQEITRVLPDTQVMEMATVAEARARARNEAKATAQAAVQQIRRDREALRTSRTALAGMVLAVVLLSSTVWLGGLVFSNVRDRRSEIGILRALGVTSPKVAGLVLARSLLLGVIGTLLGYALGIALAITWAEDPSTVDWYEVALRPVLSSALLVAAPLWCGVASLAPALIAARQDPAVALAEM